MMADGAAPPARPPYSRLFSSAPEAIVQDGKFQYGCYDGPARRANMLDVERPYHYPVPRWVKALRCKEWRAFQAGNKRWFFFTALYEAKTFSAAMFYLWDRQERQIYQIKRLLPAVNFGIGECLDGERIGYQNRHSAISYKTDLSGGLISVEASRSRHHGLTPFKLSFQFSYNTRQAAPSTVCLPLGLNRAMYSTKVLMPMRGWLELGEERFEFDGGDAMGIMDDHKGLYDYRMRYDWVTGFGLDAKRRRVGFNLTNNQVKDQSQYNENVLWINSRVFPLPPVTMTRPQGPDGVWHIQDTEGLVDLSFKPEFLNPLQVNAIVIASNYHGPFGSFDGLLRTPDGAEKIDVRKLYGMGEQKYLRA
ncbi:MAG: hypothetical protein A2087_06835 [Spirochaetes bacterium GWD1_61_31]|nr:MAG: hypothetical protein A2Y37_08635 [Spirochaetes bacterium GWB1_60_80]OHD31840.1 MAG: hypothetical protein A2004_10010 [Spirochaetes bacterium GWC1_61_12]OHD40064.1 MAG: hypothetical protein A2087_06835 [Spirochaetes bacterium GWD1_61_31]HAW85413.1 hypothetical protein [Spirochaetaceae bacterium]HCQ85992.1 hypothetical protein [Spirochaetaceae bacterium]